MKRADMAGPRRSFAGSYATAPNQVSQLGVFVGRKAIREHGEELTPRDRALGNGPLTTFHFHLSSPAPTPTP